MAELMQEEKKTFPKEPCDKTLLLSSLKSYAKDGAEMGGEKLLQPRKNNFGKATRSAILTITGEMPKLRMYDLDEDGQYIMYEDEMTGEERRKIKIDDGQFATIFFPFYANIRDGEDGLDENTTLIITPGTSSYSFFKEALIDSGELPVDMGNQSFATNYAELKEAVEGFEFIGKYDVMGRQRKFPYLKVERLNKD